MVRCAGGLALGPDLLHAAREAAAQARSALGDVVPDLGCVFVTGTDHALVEAALLVAGDRLGARTTIGCSAYGVIGPAGAAEATASVSVWAASLPGVALRAFHLEVLPTDDSVVVVGMPKQRPDDRVCVLLADPWTFPVEGFVNGSGGAMPGLPLVGGLSHGARGPASSRLLVDGRTKDRGAVGVVVGGDAQVHTLVSQGCRPVGPAMTVTASEGNVLLGLAGRPALDRLREVLADLSATDRSLASRGLQMGVALDDYAEHPGQGDFLVRGIVGADEDRGGLAVGDVVPVGRTVRFQVRDADAASADLRAVLARFRVESEVEDVAGALLFSCNGRGRALFPDADHDVRLVSAGLGTANVGGFMASGEIGPVGGRNHVHGYTASMLLVGGGRP
jgi:small ligand-binding sensory domain FIST